MIRVATWNIWWRFGPWEERLPLIIDELTRVDADVIALQEVWSTDGTSSADQIATALDYESVFAGTLEMEPNVLFGNAICSRWPITQYEWRPLTAANKPSEERLVLRADIDGPNGPFQVFSTHLNWRFDHSAARQAQVRELAEFVADSRPRTYPPIVCGDFNAEPHSDEIEMLTGQRKLAVDGVLLVDAWHVAHPTDHGFTWSNENTFAADANEWNRRIDYVFVGWPKDEGQGKPLSAELIGTKQIGALWPSDHYGLVAELTY
jgi:endonuclease/exonuclease/phosphatase family metal-dependent hydrolase